MSPQAQRMAIAEACGWARGEDAEIVYGSGRFYPRWYHAGTGRGAHGGELPDYLSDLNAMHEAEKVLTKEQRGEYAAYISSHSENPLSLQCPEFGEVFAAIHSTAAQRSEAFLRTLDLWDDTK